MALKPAGRTQSIVYYYIVLNCLTIQNRLHEITYEEWVLAYENPWFKSKYCLGECFGSGQAHAKDHNKNFKTMLNSLTADEASVPKSLPWQNLINNERWNLCVSDGVLSSAGLC